MAAVAILDFWDREILLVIVVLRVETHQHVKFWQNQSNGCEDIKIFRFFKMAAVAILDFRNREFLFAVVIWRAQSHHCTKFCQNRSFRCGDIAFFRIFKMAAAPSWIFKIAKFCWLLCSRGRRRISVPNFVKIGQSVAKILRFFDFSRWYLGLVWGIFGPPTVSTYGSLSLCKIWFWSMQ